ncbi:hypothetical protein LV84_01315 [Algoriphagus ratkowskyi]|uniref:Phosphopeptide-binding protein n=1 Tax=Algoriphagus ratkowskyi TaxID=57028 RepID=A0A2W7S8L7_9BACT|nr:hypothetical protein [Algoriphagus ratkowskyi]PZX59285.1 hypothetical protein LV84_01315 [Algoriphagus ratkowskyi]TXD77445.1 hypothetical protein ESW18_11615 [Algoriphagus ratkowskyi]
MNIKILGTAAVALLMAVSCQPKKVESEEVVEMEMNTPAEISIEKFTDTPAYSSSSLTLKKPTNTTIAKAGEVDFAFDVKDYKLGEVTERNGMAENLANSDQGQHIHFILDNQPYSAHYEAEFKREMPEGTHYLVAFLSRSYHESVKNSKSFIAKKMVVGKASDDLNVDFAKPTMIYSRPKGEYSGADTENLLLDFFLLNTTLSETGNKVRATINGQEFMITDWAPYVIKGLAKGEVTIKLELLDADGTLIPGGFNDVTRTVTLKD